MKYSTTCEGRTIESREGRDFCIVIVVSLGRYVKLVFSKSILFRIPLIKGTFVIFAMRNREGNIFSKKFTNPRVLVIGYEN